MRLAVNGYERHPELLSFLRSVGRLVDAFERRRDRALLIGRAPELQLAVFAQRAFTTRWSASSTD
jgi:hypothetical protein